MSIPSRLIEAVEKPSSRFGGGVLYLPPAKTGISAVDLTAENGTQYEGNELDLTGARSILIFVSWTITGGASAGAIRIDASVTDAAGTTLDSGDLTGNKTATSSGDGFLALAIDGTNYAGFTAGSTPKLPIICPVFRPLLTVITQSDAATSAVASLSIVAYK